MSALYYITLRLYYHISIFKNMGVAANGPHPFSDIAPRVSLVKIFRNLPSLDLQALGVKRLPWTLGQSAFLAPLSADLEIMTVKFEHI